MASKWTLVDTLDVARNKLNARWAKADRQTAARVEEMGKDNSRRFIGRKREGGSNTGRLLPRGVEPTPGMNGATPDHPVLPAVLVASTGPAAPAPLRNLAPARKDESLAYIEAARQYATVYDNVLENIAAMEKLGVKIDREKMLKSIALPQDPHLAAVADVLPYITSLEQQNARAQETIADLRAKVEGLPELKRERDRLSEQNRRLVGENATLRERLAGRAEPVSVPKAAAPSAGSQ